MQLFYGRLCEKVESTDFTTRSSNKDFFTDSKAYLERRPKSRAHRGHVANWNCKIDLPCLDSSGINSLLSAPLNALFFSSLPLPVPFVPTSAGAFSASFKLLTSPALVSWLSLFLTAVCFPQSFVTRRSLSMISLFRFSLFTSTRGPFRLRSPRVIGRGWSLLDPTTTKMEDTVCTIFKDN